MKQALIMSGGASSRMRRSLGPIHKSLLQIGGATLLERNISQLMQSGFNRITVAIGCHEPELESFVHRIACRLVEHGCELECYVESQPLGTIGAAGQVGLNPPLLIVNVDNLTNLNLNDFVEFHLQQQASLAVACHNHKFTIPFGRLEVDDQSAIKAYEEKPDILVPISSGTYVLGRKAIEWIKAKNGRCDIPDLVNGLHSQQQKVVAYSHQALWIDVNDAEAFQNAESLIAENPSEFGQSLEVARF